MTALRLTQGKELEIPHPRFSGWMWSGPTFTSFHFFFVGQGGGSAAETMKSQRGDVVSRPLAADSSLEWHPVIWHRLFSRTLPTVTRRNLV